MTKEQTIKHLKLMQSGTRNAIRFTKNDKEISEEERKEDIEIYQDQLEALEMAIKALEQQPSDDVMAIHTQGLAEGIRCAMCTNSMKSDRGCDGGCRVDEDMYKRVMETINNQMFSQPISDDCVSRAEMLKYQQYLHGKMSNEENHKLWEFIKDLPSVTPTFPKGATNGDMIKAMFPKIEIYTDVINEIVDVEICEDSSELRCSIDWWNAPYEEKRGGEND